MPRRLWSNRHSYKEEAKFGWGDGRLSFELTSTTRLSIPCLPFTDEEIETQRCDGTCTLTGQSPHCELSIPTLVLLSPILQSDGTDRY